MGDRSSVTVIKERLKTPTAVEPAGGTIWIAERGRQGRVNSDAEIERAKEKVLWPGGVVPGA